MSVLRKLVCRWLLFLLCIFAPALVAQEYRGSISGGVTDRTKAAIQDATITAMGPQQTYTVKTGKQGDYILPFVQPGTYAVTASSPGFSTEARQDVVVDVSGKINLNFSLRNGSVSDVVTVEADQVDINTADASGGAVLDQEKVQSLPLNGRQIYTMLDLIPGVKFTTTNFSQTGNSGTRGWDQTNAYSINGQPGLYNQFLLNGAPITQQNGGAAGTWNIAPSVDAVQEFKVMFNTYDAQYGRAGGGVINTILKGGTNTYHGTLYDFWRNSVMEANRYELNQQNSPRGYHNQHQFGGTIGGFFQRNKGYYFFSYEGWREIQPGGLVTTVPTPDMYPDASGNVNLDKYMNAVGKTGGIYDPFTSTCATSSSSGCTNYTRTKFANNIIPANRISAVGLASMRLFPMPNRPGYSKNYVYDGSNPYTYNMPIARVDYNFTDATRLYGIFAWWSGLTSRNSNGLPGPAAMGGIDSYRSSLTQVLDLTHTFNARRVGDIRFSYNRMWNRVPSGTVAAGIDHLTAADLHLTIPNIPTSTRDWAPSINLGDNFPSMIGNTGDPTIYETYDMSPSITQAFGSHNLHIGAEFALYHDVASGIGQRNGTFAFNTVFTQQNPQKANKDGSIIANLLLGYPSSGSIQYQTAPYEAYNYYAAYVQDDFRALDNLTFNLGVRWDTETSPRERQNRLLAGFCFTCVNPITNQIAFPTGNVLPNGAAMVNPILGGVQFAGPKLSAYSNNFGLIQPKIGVSWAIQPRLVLRGGWTLATALGIELGNNADFGNTTNYVASPDNNVHPSLDFANGNPFPNGYLLPPGSSDGLEARIGNSLSVDLRDRKIPVVQQYSFGMQTSLPWKMIADLSYAGAHSIYLRAPVNFNGLKPADFQKGHDEHAYLDQLVHNPFYGVLPKSTSLGATSTIAAKYLMVPYPQYDGSLATSANPKGYNYYNALYARLEKRLSSSSGPLVNGLSFLSSFSWSKNMSATAYLNNSGAGLVDPTPYYGIDGTDRPWVFAFAGLYGLPVGRGGMIAGGASGAINQLISGWQLTWIFKNQSGTPASYPNTFNFNCGDYDIRPSQRSWKSYFNNLQPSCWTTFPEYTATIRKPLTTAVRNPWAQQTALGLQKKFSITERAALQFKAEVFNFTNTPIFAAPSAGSPETALTRNASVADPNQPGAWSGFGTIGSTQQNFPRQIQLSAKIAF